MKDPLTIEVRVATNLLNAVPFHACLDDSYGDEDDDYNLYEHLISWLNLTCLWPYVCQEGGEASALRER